MWHRWTDQPDADLERLEYQERVLTCSTYASESCQKVASTRTTRMWIVPMLLTFDSLGNKLEIGDLNRAQTDKTLWVLDSLFQSPLQKLVYDRGHQHWCTERRRTGTISPRSSMLKGWATGNNKNSHRGGSTNHIRAKPNKIVKTSQEHTQVTGGFMVVQQFVDYTEYINDFDWEQFKFKFDNASWCHGSWSFDYRNCSQNGLVDMHLVV